MRWTVNSCVLPNRLILLKKNNMYINPFTKINVCLICLLYTPLHPLLLLQESYTNTSHRMTPRKYRLCVCMYANCRVSPKVICKRPKSLCQTFIVMHMEIGYFSGLLPSQESCSRNTSDSLNSAATEQENANLSFTRAQPDGTEMRLL